MRALGHARQPLRTRLNDPNLGARTALAVGFMVAFHQAAVRGRFPCPLGAARSIGKRCAMRMDALGKRHTCWIGMRMATSILLAAPPAFAGDAKRGEPMFQRYCTGCHGADGRGGGKNFMPHVGALTRPGYTELLDDRLHGARHHRRRGGLMARAPSCRPSRRHCRRRTLPT